MSDLFIGVIGGSGLYDMEGFVGREEKRLETPFGDPSDAVIVGESTQLDIAISQKGHIGIFLDFIGKASHPTKADLHANPVFHLAKVMDFLQLFAQRVLHNRQGSFVVLEVSAGEKGVLTPPR